MTTYYGWSTPETYEVFRKIEGDFKAEDFPEKDVKKIASYLRAYCVNAIIDDAQGIALTFAMRYIDKVIWDEIARTMIKMWGREGDEQTTI